MLRPGWGGFFMGMARLFLSLVVVNQFKIKGINAFKAENNSPICANCDGSKPFQVTLKRMQTVTR